MVRIKGKDTPPIPTNQLMVSLRYAYIPQRDMCWKLGPQGGDVEIVGPLRGEA
jgi:hypothetical protein